jgi:hypothetical protein
MIKRLVYSRNRTMGIVNTGESAAARTTREAIDSGFVKFGTRPGGGGYAPTVLLSVEFMTGASSTSLE